MQWIPKLLCKKIMVIRNAMDLLQPLLFYIVSLEVSMWTTCKWRFSFSNYVKNASNPWIIMCHVSSKKMLVRKLIKFYSSLKHFHIQENNLV
jgi:hypothetical protein